MNKIDLDSFSLSASQACETLNISRQTLYAYVSRGKIRAHAEIKTEVNADTKQNNKKKDARKSLYHKQDVETLLELKKTGRDQRAAPRKTKIPNRKKQNSNISQIKNGKLFYKNIDAIELSKTASFEDIIKLFLDIDFNTTTKPNAYISSHKSALYRMILVLSDGMINTSKGDHQNNIARLIKELTMAITGCNEITNAPIHEQIAQSLHHNHHPDFNIADLTRRTLVLSIDHGLKPATQTARLTASTGAGLEACLMSAISTYSAPKQNAMSALCRWWISRAAMKDGKDLEDFIKKTKTPPGFESSFGSSFDNKAYKGIDPRAEELLNHMPIPHNWDKVAKAVQDRFDLYPNFDFALAALEKNAQLPMKTGQNLFIFARMIGWMAHSIEAHCNEI